MAGSISMTPSGNSLNNFAELLISWVGDASTGAVPTLAITGYTSWWITKLQTNPGSTAPTAAYDITLIDSDGADLADGSLLDRSAALTEIETLASQIPSGGFMVIIANQSEASATGTIRIFLNR